MKLIAILVLAASTMAVYAVQHPKADDAMPAAEGIEIPRIVIVGKREHAAERNR